MSLVNEPEGDALEVLASAGFPVWEIPEGQREVFAALSPEEVALLVDIKRRLNAFEPEVQPHSGVIAGGAMF